ncbi:MAG TPA: MFS transporter [Acidimicrobiales bacterium]|nr:MFS transporter [Acidimicrobiales bacterium]
MGPVDTAGPAATNRTFDVLSLGTFVLVGLPDGMLGTAWPAMRHSFGEPVGDLGFILLVSTVGSVLVATFVGRLLRRVGAPALLGIALGCAATGGVGFALAPGLWLVLSIGVLVGAASGMMDGGLNTAVALTGRTRLLNLLHGFYGIGATIGPLVVTAAILSGTWRPAYLAFALLDLVVAASWLLYRRRGGGAPAARASGGVETPPADPVEVDPVEVDPVEVDPLGGRSRRHVVSVLAAGMAIFFVYTGLEVGAGQWETSFLRGHLGLSASVAGLSAFGYFGALTAVRIGLAFGVFPAGRVIRWGCLIGAAATGLIWWQPDPAVTVAGFVVLGGALAGVFPALVAVTPQRIGRRRAEHAIAWQVGAAAAGGSAISALIGVLINATSLAVLGPSLVVLAVVLLVAVAALARLAPIRSLPPRVAAGR